MNQIYDDVYSTHEVGGLSPFFHLVIIDKDANLNQDPTHPA